MSATVLTREESNERLFAVAWRWALVLIGAFSVSELIHARVGTSADNAVNLATTGVAMSVVLAFLADLMTLFQGCWKYLKGETQTLGTVTSGLWKAWASLTTIIVAVNGWLRPAEGVPLPPEPWFIVYSTAQASDPPPSSGRRAMFPVLYARSADQKNWTTGVSFTKDEVDVSMTALERIFAGYQACGSVAGKPMVQLEIVGYASSKEFAGTSSDDSNLLNIDAANKRAWAAYCFVADHGPVQLTNADLWTGEQCKSKTREQTGVQPAIAVTVNRWTRDQAGFKKMMNARALDDRPPGLPPDERDPEELNRRVDFNVIHAGACQRTAVPATQVAHVAR